MEKVLTQRSIGDIARESEELVRNARALYPDLPGANLLEHIIALADPDFLAELHAVLRAKHFLGIDRADRAKNRREELEAEWLTQEIRNAVLTLPLRVPVGDGKTVPRGELRFPDTGRYLKYLDKEARDSKKKDARRSAVKAIRKGWPRAQRARRMTIAEVDTQKAKRAGLI
jgi:hypothetical protein